jgi:tRNA modification GTPase
MNLIAGYEKAIVTPVAGTTRDVLEQRVYLGGAALLLADTAGIRESGDEVERIGVTRAIDRLNRSSLVLAVFDSSRALSDDDRALIERIKGRRAIAIVNKIDLETALDVAEIESAFGCAVSISANDLSSLKALDAAVRRTLKTENLSPDAPMLMNERQRTAAVKALDAANDALESAKAGMTLDVIYATLDEVIAAILELSGENVSDAVVNEVFSRFCVGK